MQSAAHNAGRPLIPETPLADALTSKSLRPIVFEARQLLRSRTHDIHVRLDHHPLLAGITKPGYPMAAYRLVLAGYFHFYRGIEAAIEEFLASGETSFDYASRRKLPWIIADLKHFEVDPLAIEFSPSRPVGPFSINTFGQLVGTLYAVEGSMLGGQVISRHLAKNLGLTASNGARFFNGYGEKTPTYWGEFQAFLEMTCIDADARDQAGLAAETTFSQVEGLLDDYCVKL